SPFVPGQGADGLAGLGVPEADVAVHAAAGQVLAVGAPGDPADPPGVPPPPRDLRPPGPPPGPPRPRAPRTVEAAGVEAPAVRAEGHVITRTCVAPERQCLLAGRHIPDSDRRILAPCRGQPPAVRAEGEGADKADVPLEVVDQRAGRGVPEPH